MKKILSIWICLILSLSITSFSYADESIQTYEDYAKKLEKIGIFYSADYGYQLDRQSTRLEVATLLVRLLGVEDLVKEKEYNHVFIDVPKWASNTVGYLYHNRYIRGINHNQFGSQQPMDVQDFATLILRVLGYNDVKGDFDYGLALDILLKKDIINKAQYKELQEGPMLRKHVVWIVYHTLLTPIKNTNKTLAEFLLVKEKITLDVAKKIGIIPDEYKVVALNTLQYLTNYNPYDYLKLEVVNGSHINVTGQTDNDKRQWLWTRLQNNKNYAYDVRTKLLDGQISMNLTNEMKDNLYQISVYTNIEKNGNYHSWINNIDMEKKENKLRFLLTPVYLNNYEKFHFGKRVLDMETILEPSYSVQSDDIKIIKLAQNITRQYDTDYQKAMAIHDWVAKNIYYDMDGYNNDVYSVTDALGVLESKKSVCQGYAFLTAALMRATGIPCAVVVGYALGMGSDMQWTQDNFGLDESNHAWNEVYIDDRWIMMDTTWDSRNEFINGKFVYRGMNSRIYFDTTLEHFSTKHKIMEYCSYY